jgi:hypothetical protein
MAKLQPMLSFHYQGFFSPFWEYNPYPWNWEFHVILPEIGNFFASLGNKKFYTYLILSIIPG